VLRSRGEASILDPAAAAASRGYGAVTPRLLRELSRIVDRATAALPRVRTPTLAIHSRRDNRVPVAAAEAAFARLGAREKEIVWLDGSAHVITVDYEKERVYDLVADWVERGG
jgi:carboxylesterase